MDSQYKKKLKKVFAKIDKIAAKGKDSIQEFKDYIDELVEKGDYSYFIEVCYISYNIDIYDVVEVNEAIQKTWPEILFQTKTPFLSKLSNLYKQKKVYQQSTSMYSDDLSVTQTFLSDRYSATYSVTGLSPSIAITRQGGNIFLNVNDGIDYVEIKKAEWQTISGIYQPANQKLIEEFYLIYGGASFTTINLGTLVPLQSFTMSVDVGMSFHKDQLLRVTNNVDYGYFEGYVNSYNYYNGDLNIKPINASGSGTYSFWWAEYVSGTQSPTFQTNISVDYASEYAIYTTDFNNDYKYVYRLSVTKNSYIGEIEEVDLYSQDPKYLTQNKQLAKILGQRKFYLQVTKAGYTQSFAILYDNPALSEDMNLIEKYRLAVDYLLS